MNFAINNDYNSNGNLKFVLIATTSFGVGLLIAWWQRWIGAPAWSQIRQLSSSSSSSLPSSQMGGVVKSSWIKWLTFNYKLVLVVCPPSRPPRKSSTGSTTGLMAAHCSSASILALKTASRQAPLSTLFWTITGQPKVVLRGNNNNLNHLANEAKAQQLCTVMIIDKHTGPEQQQQQQQPVVLAIGPGPSKILNQITGSLKLY